MASEQTEAEAGGATVTVGGVHCSTAQHSTTRVSFLACAVLPACSSCTRHNTLVLCYCMHSAWAAAGLKSCSLGSQLLEPQQEQEQHQRSQIRLGVGLGVEQLAVLQSQWWG